jgi:cytochrome c oxidase subunit I
MATLTVTEELTRTWEDKPGFIGWLATVDHKKLGKRYLATAFAFFLIGGIEAIFLRAQLIRPLNTALGPGAFNELFTMHGTTMIFLFATPVMTGFGVYFVPLMIGTRDLAFPRLNSFTYWAFLLSGIFLYSSFAAGSPPDGGWFNYAPLTGSRFAPGHAIDFWSLGIIFLGISTTGAAINVLVTIFKLRAPGMTVSRLPVFVWTIIAQALIVVFAIPPLTLSAILLTLDRKLGMHFYDAAAGGDPLLWQHLFWIFGHPEVYLVFIPATGIISTIIPTFARRPIAAYTWVVTATIATAIIGFGVWVHHMYAVGLPPLTLSFFVAASLIIAIPSGVQVFAWLMTLVRGRPHWTTSMLYSVGFLVIFTLGGITGVMVAVAPFDWQVTDSYFVVAHFHYVMAGAALIFPVLAALYYWVPKIHGRMLSERLGKISFGLVFLGFNLTFFPQHILGFLGMPRRVYTYDRGLGWDVYNLLSSLGAFVLAAGVLILLVDYFRAVRSGPRATPNPWGASTLEWATTSPPEEFNFEVPPVVHSRDPLWDEPEPVSRRSALAGPGRRVMETAGLDAVAEKPTRLAEPSIWPLGLATSMALMFGGILVENLVLIGVGVAGSALSLLVWLRPGAGQEEPA